MTKITRADLEQLSRRDLQARCKANSIKANSSTETLIQSLLHYYQSGESQAKAPTASALSKAKTTATRGNAETVDARVAQQPKAAVSGAESANNDSTSAITCDDTEALNRISDATATYMRLHLTTQERIDRLNERVMDSNTDVHSTLEERTLQLRLTINKVDERLAPKIKEGEEHRARLSTEIEQLKARVTALEELRLAEMQQWSSKYEEALERARSSERTMEERLERLERALKEDGRASEKGGARQSATNPSPYHNPSVPSSTATRSASPALSDAPPTRSLLNFSPIASPALPIQSTPIHATSAHALARTVDVPTLGRSLFPSTVSPARVSALPPHMIASSSRTPRASGYLASMSQLANSPFVPVQGASLGKRARESDASNLSVDLEPIVRPPRDDTFDLGSSTRVAEGPSSPQRQDGHSRKRSRVSVRADIDELDNSVVAPESHGVSCDDYEEDADEEEEENSIDSVREYLVPTKTGESPAVIYRPANQSINDPSFFSAPSSPAVLTPGRRSTLNVNENTVPRGIAAGPRQSLPVSALPFPLVSPFAKKDRSTPSFATPASPAFVNRSNQTSVIGFQSPSKLSSTSIVPRSTARSSVSRPKTPVASKTLYGTEEESRFGDQFDTAEEDNNTGVDASWSNLRAGAFF